MGVMLYADGSVFGGKWQSDLKADGVFIDGSNNWTCGKGGVVITAKTRDVFPICQAHGTDMLRCRP